MEHLINLALDRARGPESPREPESPEQGYKDDLQLFHQNCKTEAKIIFLLICRSLSKQEEGAGKQEGAGGGSREEEEESGNKEKTKLPRGKDPRRIEKGSKRPG